ncbi:MAG: sensor histidine kinase [Rhodospirillaceae bacterium]
MSAAPAEPAQKPPVTGVHRSLSSRLLVLCVLFVMVAEVLIYLPSIARFRLEYLNERLAQCHLALLTLQATQEGMVDTELQMELLRHAGAFGMTARAPYQETLTLGEYMIRREDASFDLRSADALTLIMHALEVLPRDDDRVLSIIGWSPKDSDVVIRAFISEAALRAEMVDYSWRILILSLMISGLTGVSMFLVLHWMIVRPMRRLAFNMTEFRDAPQDPNRVVIPSRRSDEIGLAERALRELQDTLRRALGQQARLAGVGTAVSKIAHDLKGVLTTALLESDRLEMMSADPEVRIVTKGIAGALERAVNLCGNTLNYAKEGPPEAALKRTRVTDTVALAMAAAYTTNPEADRPKLSLQELDGLIVWADPDHLTRIFSNLFLNAGQAKASLVRVARHRGTQEDGVEAIYLDIADDGPGLPKKALENLFQPFSGSAKAGGTGLGLAISLELARSQGGDLSLLSSGAGGAVFRLRLPVPPAGSEPLEEPEPETKRKSGTEEPKDQELDYSI